MLPTLATAALLLLEGGEIPPLESRRQPPDPVPRLCGSADGGQASRLPAGRRVDPHPVRSHPQRLDRGRGPARRRAWPSRVGVLDQHRTRGDFSCMFFDRHLRPWPRPSPSQFTSGACSTSSRSCGGTGPRNWGQGQPAHQSPVPRRRPSQRRHTDLRPLRGASLRVPRQPRPPRRRRRAPASIGAFREIYQEDRHPAGPAGQGRHRGR